MMKTKLFFSYILWGVTLGIIIFSLGCAEKPYDPNIQDEAKKAGKTKEDYPTHWYNMAAALPTANFAEMDNGVLKLKGDNSFAPAKGVENEVKGRNTWIIWTAGNSGFWDYLARHSYGLLDFLKLLDNRSNKRSERFAKFGLINEPDMRESTVPSNKLGLWLDVPSGWKDGDWPPEDPVAYKQKYPSVPDPYVYGYSSGVMGFRLFPNPAFFEGDTAEDAQEDWDPERFISDLNYNKDPDLIRPYRVGMSCGFCHISFNPIQPPDDSREPEWKNLMSNMGSQYFKFGPIFGPDLKKSNLIWYLVNYPKPGTLDTSLLATDGNNNPNVMNSVWNLAARIGISLNVKPETISQESTNMPVLDLSALGINLPDGNKRFTPYILGDGSDSIGARGALERVFLNIGEFHEEWVQIVNPMIGITPQKPFRIKKAQENSVYFQVTEQRAQNVALFFLKSTDPKLLKDAPGGPSYQTKDLAQLRRGKSIFAQKCFVCHSSKQPDGELGNDGRFWDDSTNWRKWLRNPDYLSQAELLVQSSSFLENNYLSTDQRYDVTDIGINIGRFVADNAKSGRIWDDFSSNDYKEQKVITKTVELQHPYKRGKTFKWNFTSDIGPGRVRPLTLNSMWATAPYLHNNSVGEYAPDHDPANRDEDLATDVSVSGRMKTFNNSINQLLGIEARKGFDSIERTETDIGIEVFRVVILDFVEKQLGTFWKYFLIVTLVALLLVGFGLLILGIIRIKERRKGRIITLLSLVIGFLLAAGVIVVRNKESFHMGYFPKGTPVNLILNLNSPGWYEDEEHVELLWKIAWDLGEMTLKKLPSLDHPDVPDLVDNLLKLNKAPDFVLDKGHTFGNEDLTLPEKLDLIEFLKTM